MNNEELNQQQMAEETQETVEFATTEGYEVSPENYFEQTYEDYYDEDTPSNERISGWLSVFLYLGIGGGLLISLLFNLYEFDKLNTPSLFKWLDMAFYGALAVTGVMTIIGFYRRWRDAVYMAMTFVTMNFIQAFIVLCFGDVSGDDVFSSSIRPMAWSAIWFIYLLCSAKVERIIPRAYRKMTLRCWILIAACVLTLGASCTMVFSYTHEIESKMANRKNVLSTLKIGADEYSDGVYIAKKPVGMTMDQKEDEASSVPVFNFTEEGSADYAIITTGGYQFINQEIFDQIWNETEYSISQNIGTSLYSTNKTIKLDTPYEVFFQSGEITQLFQDSSLQLWLVVLYDPATKGVCQIIYRAPENDDLAKLKDFVKNVKFIEN